MFNNKTASALSGADAATNEITPTLYPTKRDQRNPLDTEARETFLALVPTERRNAASQLFLLRARAGEANPTQIVRDVAQKLCAAYRESETAPEREATQALLEAVCKNENAAIAFAAYAIQWEALSVAEKRRIKNQRAAQHIAPDSMAGKPVTDAQRWKLRQLGSSALPTDRAEASALINGLINGKAGAK